MPEKPGGLGQGSLRLLTLLAPAAAVLTVAAWAAVSLSAAVEQAGEDLVQHAELGAARLATSLRDARRTAQSVEHALGATTGAAEPSAVLLRERDLRFDAGTPAVLLAADGSQRAAVGVAGSAGGTRPSPAEPPQPGRREWLARSPVCAQAACLAYAYRMVDGATLVIGVPLKTLAAALVMEAGLEAGAGAGAARHRMAVSRADGSVVWKAGPDPAAFEDSLAAAAARDARPRQPSAQQNTSQQPTSQLLRSTDANGATQLVAWAPLDAVDARVLAAAPLSGVAAEWFRRSGSKLLALALLLLVASGMLLRAQRRVAAGDARVRAALAEESRAKQLMRQALDAGHGAVWHLGPEDEMPRLEADLPLLRQASAPGADAARDAAGDPALGWKGLLERLGRAQRIEVEHALATARTLPGPLHLAFTAASRGSGARHFVMRGEPVFDADGAPAGLAGTLEDVTELTRSQVERDAALHTLERMCELARVAPWHVEPAQGRLVLSPQARELYGLAPTEDPPPWPEVTAALAPAEQQRLHDAHQALMEHGTPYDLVLQWQAADGGPRWLRTTAGKRVDEAGEVRIEGALQDVSALVSTQRLLRESDRRARLLAEAITASSQGVLTTDAGRSITWCNAAFTRTSGWTLDEIRGRNPADVLLSETEADTERAELRRRVRRGEAVAKVRLKNRSRDGRTYWIELEVRPLLGSDGLVEAYVDVHTDITDSLERLQALREQQRRNRLAAETAGIGFWSLDLAGGQLQHDPLSARILGLPEATVAATREALTARVLPEDRALAAARFEAALAISDASEWHGQYRVGGGDDATRWVRESVVIERDPGGRPLRAAGVLHDVSDAQALAEERQARLESAARDAAKDRFLAGMSHELRTPLNAVIGYARLLLLDRDTLPAKAGERAQRIEHAAWHLLALIDGLLDLGRAGGGNLSVHTEPCDLLPLCESALALVQPEAEAAGVAVHARLEPALALADGTRAVQVFVNLLGNAIKYNRRGGRVWLDLGAVSGAAPGAAAAEVAVEVRDDGLGMSAEQLGQLFQPFNRLGRERSAIQGTGIGLAISKALVERMGGRIEVRSAPGEGSSFRVVLPAAG